MLLVWVPVLRSACSTSGKASLSQCSHTLDSISHNTYLSFSCPSRVRRSRYRNRHFLQRHTPAYTSNHSRTSVLHPITYCARVAIVIHPVATDRRQLLTRRRELDIHRGELVFLPRSDGGAPSASLTISLRRDNGSLKHMFENLATRI